MSILYSLGQIDELAGLYLRQVRVVLDIIIARQTTMMEVLSYTTWESAQNPTFSEDHRTCVW